MKQQDLADLLGVSRQTIYYLEKGTYTPKLTLSLNIARIFDKPTEEVFYLEPIIKDVIGNITIDDLDRISNETRIQKERIGNLRKITNEKLVEEYTQNELESLSNALGFKFNDLFED